MIAHPCRAVLLAVVLLMSCVSAARASVVVPMSLADLTMSAHVIVDGRVAEVRHVAARGGAERIVVVRVASAWKGDVEGDVVYVRLPGGTVGRYRTVVPGAPDVAPGDRFVWFLAASSRGGHAVLGLHQGVMRVTQAADGHAMAMSPAWTTGRVLRGDGQRRPRRLDVLADHVRALLAREAAQ